MVSETIKVNSARLSNGETAFVNGDCIDYTQISFADGPTLPQITYTSLHHGPNVMVRARLHPKVFDYCADSCDHRDTIHRSEDHRVLASQLDTQEGLEEWGFLRALRPIIDLLST